MMNLPRAPLVTILLITAATRAFAQEQPNAVLIDEFGPLPCADMQARAENLATEVLSEPRSRGIILIYKPSLHPEQASGRRKLISSAIENRDVNMDRFSFYRSETSPDGDIRTRLWKLSVGAEPPLPESTLWRDEILDTSRPFIFGFAEDIDECPSFVPKAFAKLILDNPGARGRIVVRMGSYSLENRFSFADRYIKKLVEEQGVPRNRLRLIFAKSADKTIAEFWFVPARKK